MIKGKGLKGMLVLSSFICMLLFTSIELKAVEPQKTQKPEITEIEGIKSGLEELEPTSLRNSFFRRIHAPALRERNPLTDQIRQE